MSQTVIVSVTSEQSYFARNDTTMERSRLGLVLILLGVILFVISLFVILLLFDFYLISLFAMFASVMIIAVGFAYTKRDESTSDDSN